METVKTSKETTSNFVSTKELSEIFNMSERRILQLVEGGIIEKAPGAGRKGIFNLATVVPQYSKFLLLKGASGITVDQWAPDTPADQKS